MPANPATAKDFLLTSDFPIDQVIYKHEFTRNVAKATFMADSKLYTIAHGLSFTPLCFGAFSDDGFVTSFEFGTGPRFFNPTFMLTMNRIMAVVESDATNIYVRAINFDNTRNITFRVCAVAPSDAAGDMPPPTNTGGFILSTDLNYMKVIDKGVTPSISATGPLIVPHPLGYVPMALLFSEDVGIGRVRQVGAENQIGNSGIYTRAALRATSLGLDVVDNGGGAPVRFHYRIYGDA